MRDENHRIEKIVIISGPSGAGKSTVCDYLLKTFSDRLVLSVSETTRAKRKTEQSGRHYIYITAEEFQKRLERFHYYEWFFLHGHYYGTPRRQLNACFVAGQVPLLDIDVNGMQRISRLFPHHLSLFIAPVSLDQLRVRLQNRSTDSLEQIQIRMETAKQELARQSIFQHIVVNDRLEETLKKSEAILSRYLNG